MKKLASDITDDDMTTGSVYVMTHSFFSDVIRIGCTPNDTTAYAKSLSENSPGEYTVVFTLECDNPCNIKKQIQTYLNAHKYVNEFYQVPPEVAAKLLTRETLKIPILTT
jgi:hypothetical protein